MNKFHAMILRRSIATLASLAVTSLMFLAPIASALNVTDVTDTLSNIQDAALSTDECSNLDSGMGASLGCDTTDKVTDFTTYTGTLEGPDASGYDSKLTQNTNARDFIKNIVNFALSFLGLVAVVIVIYGGVLYTTSRGDEESTGKGKKAITYAGIGIIIILGSFAFVNTILTAGGGGGSDIGNGTSTNGTTITDAGAAFDVDGTLAAIENITADYKTTYDSYISVSQEVSALQAETDAEVISVIVDGKLDDYLSKLKAGIGNIQAESDPYSASYESAQAIYTYLASGTMTATDVSDITGMLTDVQTAADEDYTEQVVALVARMDDLGSLFDANDTLGTFNSGSTLASISNGSTGTYDKALNALTLAEDTIQSSTVRNIVSTMNDFHSSVSSLEFVKVSLTASTVQGNAPVIVRFNALGTEDPSGNTVVDSNIQWDLDGDSGEKPFSTNSITGQPEPTGAAVSMTYTEAGTYRVRVRALSTSQDVAAGIATVTIVVNPARSKVVLDATVGSDTAHIADFTKYPSSPNINASSYKVTMAEAQAGIKFDASKTTDGDGNVNGISLYEWDFGDNYTCAGAKSEDCGATVTHAYGQAGSYTVSFGVTDSTGIQDRKFFTLYVASPAARISYFPEFGPVGTSFNFDSSASSVDVGQIVSRQWTATLKGADVALGNATGTSIDQIFNTPGIYTVTLVVADNSNQTDTASADILVESTPPVASFQYTIASTAQPATLTLDAKDSYDPDIGDAITYEWDLDGIVNTDYKILEGTASSQQITVQYLKTNDYNVVLTVKDSQTGEFQKSDTASTIISIGSVLDVNLDVGGSDAKHLDGEGKADVEFTASSENATSFEIDFGDSTTDFTDSIASGKAIFSHTYEAAGVFYVTLTALDDIGSKNEITRRVYIGAGDSPIAVANVTADGEDIGFGELLVGNVNTKFSFDGTGSVDVDGTNTNLVYSWNFGDGSTATQSSVTHTFREHIIYTVTLTVKDRKDATLTSTATVQIRIDGIPPEIHSITVVPDSTTLTTPLKVNVSVDASDADGKITYVKAWYYDVDDTATELGTVISQSTSFTLTVNTKGEAEATKEYGFAAEVTDNDNNSVSSFDTLDPTAIPTLTVTNGPNENPTAGFTVNKSNVYIGEEVNFSSTSYDPDGKIVNYWWDVEGDGFALNTPETTGSYTYKFTQVHPEGIKVKLQVEDDSGATAVSDPITIYVDSLSSPPDAAFLTNVDGTNVSFVNNSVIDTKNGASFFGIFWDLDLNTDSFGNGVKDDDVDSLEENPTHDYKTLGIYSVKMTVVDSTGQTDSVTQDLDLKETAAPKAAFTSSVLDKTATFKNDSTVDKAHSVDVRSYSWDFDLNVDSNADGDPENDEDSTIKNPTNTYLEFGSYDVKMTIVDTYGKTSSVTQTVEIASPVQPIKALFTSVPQANTLGQIVLSTDGSEVSFYFNAEGGNGSATYSIDKNIFYDTDGDGIRDNDVDYSTTKSGTWKTPFYKSYGQVVTKLTVTDTETGESNFATIQVVFEGALGSANLFNATPSQLLLLLASALLTAILGVSMVFRYKPISH